MVVPNIMMLQSCGFNCQLHHIVYCLIVAYSTQRVLVLDMKNWSYRDIWLNYFLPLSEESYNNIQNITIVNWPGKNYFLWVILYL